MTAGAHPELITIADVGAGHGCFYRVNLDSRNGPTTVDVRKWITPTWRADRPSEPIPTKRSIGVKPSALPALLDALKAAQAALQAQAVTAA